MIFGIKEKWSFWPIQCIVGYCYKYTPATYDCFCAPGSHTVEVLSFKNSQTERNTSMTDPEVVLLDCPNFLFLAIVGSSWSTSAKLLASFWSARGRPSRSVWLDLVDLQKTATMLHKPVWPPQRVHPKMLSMFTHLHVVLNAFDYFSSMQHKRRSLDECPCCMVPYNVNEWGQMLSRSKKKSFEGFMNRPKFKLFSWSHLHLHIFAYLSAWRHLDLVCQLFGLLFWCFSDISEAQQCPYPSILHVHFV